MLSEPLGSTWSGHKPNLHKLRLLRKAKLSKENNIRGYFRNNKINNDDKTELIVINKNNMDQIKQHYKMMQNSYIGTYEEMNKKIVELVGAKGSTYTNEVC